MSIVSACRTDAGNRYPGINKIEKYLTWVALLVLLHGLEGSGTGNELVGPGSLVGLLAVDFLVVVSESEHCVVDWAGVGGWK
jgi:hypothetical protein